MSVMPPTPAGKLLPFESQLLTAVADALPTEWRPLLLQQIACINLVQRPLDWKEITFSCRRWVGVRWPKQVLFPERGGIRLAECECVFGARSAHIAVWAVDGHVHALKSVQGMSGLSISGPFSVASMACTV